MRAKQIIIANGLFVKTAHNAARGFSFARGCGKIRKNAEACILLIDQLVALSNDVGSRQDLVLAGGGNTSVKEGSALFIKASGTALADITEKGFVKMDRSLLSAMLKRRYPDDDTIREAMALADLTAAMLPGEEGKRPSVETLLHHLFPQRFVVHLHPAAVNALSCAVCGREESHRLFGEEALWVEACRPGYVLARLCDERIGEYVHKSGTPPRVAILQNHGLFIAADTAQEIEILLSNILLSIKGAMSIFPEPGHIPPSKEADEWEWRIAELFPAGYGICRGDCAAAAIFSFDEAAAVPLMKPFTPDHIVYCGAYPLFCEKPEDLAVDLATFRQAHDALPKIIIAKRHGFFAVGQNDKAARLARLLFDDAVEVAVGTFNFGGPLHMSDELTDFIVHWEVESYRQSRAGV